jgi:superfamily II DNA or RNA helicase
MNISREFRYYQKEADDAIYNELLVNNKCIVKMFCGTGKSLLMRKCKIVQNQKLVVYVFPSLPLIDQFCSDYFVKTECPFKISSDDNSTTNPVQIIAELKRKKHKIICVTYQSYETLLDNLGSNKIDVCIYDEAHHAVAPTYQKLIFERNNCEKQIFFTATPKDDNGIIMCDKDSGICGRTVYDYSYLKGLNDNPRVLNPFEIRVDMYTENTNKSVYESIARAILVSGNNRVLTFHADVNTDRDTSVLNFVNESNFVTAFMKVLTQEFSEKIDLYTKFKMISIDASIKMNERRAILDKFDTTLDNEIYIISSCETIGEGIDTKNANMCVFIDPKSSYVKIIQNIGRIVRKQIKPSTVLIPCWVDRDKYVGCEEDREKCDEVIRTDLNKDGNFNGILNVLSALRQEDQELYDACLNYGEDVDNKSNYSSSGDDSNSEDEYSENSGSEDNESEDELETKPKDKIKISFHTNDEIKVLWKITSDIDIMKNMCSCVLECDLYVVDNWFERFDELKKFIDENDRTPTENSKNKNEKTIGQWFSHQKQNYKNKKKSMNDTIKYEMWRQFMIDYFNYLESKELIWKNKLQNVKEYINKNNIRPSSNDNDKYVKSLGEWICGQTKKYNPDISKCKENMKNKEIYELWTDTINDLKYKKYLCIDYNEKWRKILDRVKIYIDTNNNLPSSIDEDKEIKFLGKWISIQKQNYNPNISKCKSILRERDIYELWTETINNPNYVYFLNNYKKWYQTLKDLKMFIDKNNRRPLLKNNEEKELLSWLNNQQIYYKHTNGGIMKDPKIYSEWSQFLKEYKKYFNSITEKWFENLQKLKIFINNNKKMPRQTNRTNINETERKQGKWLSHQLLNYKKKTGSMKEGSEIYNQWGQFLEEYKQYFDNTHDKSVEEVDEEEEIIITPKKKSMKLKEKKEPKETLEQRQTRTKSELSVLHQRYKTLNSQNLQKEFQETPELWHKYHAISEENEKSFPEEGIPRNRIIQELNEIKTKRTRTVVDMGCGKAQIACHFANDKRFSFINYDHISSNENVEVQDISQITLEDHSVEICILCLAMWGSNCHDYITEAHRILESGGNLYIIEATKRWTSEAEDSNPADKLKKILETNGFQITKQSLEKFSLFVCTKI